MDNYYNNSSIVNTYAYPPFPFEKIAAEQVEAQVAAQVAVNTALLITVSIMLCGIAHMEGWHDHHSIFNMNEGSIQSYVNAYIPSSEICGNKPQPSEPAFLYSVLRNKDIETQTPPPQPPLGFYRPGDDINIYKDGSNSEWLKQFDTELQKRYIICSVTLDKTGNESKIQQCFTENDINEDIFICRDVAYGNVAYDIRRWGPNSVNSKVTKVYNVQTASGVYDPGPSVSYYSDAGIKCGYQDINGDTIVSDNTAPKAKGNSRYCLFNDSKSNEQITTYPAFGRSTTDNPTTDNPKMESPEEMMYSKFNSQLFGENLASYYAGANVSTEIDTKTAKSIIDSSQVNLVVEYEEPVEDQKGKLYIVNKHSSNKATSMLDLPFICSCLKYSAAVDAIDIVKNTYPFEYYTIINQSGPLKIMTKKFGDSGIALQTLRNEFNFYSFEPTIINTNQEKKVIIKSEVSNGIHAFLSYDQVAIGAALEYGCPVVMYNVNKTLSGTHGGVLLFISRKIKEEFSNPNKIRTELNSKIATVANTDLLNTDLLNTGRYVQGKLDEVNNYAQNRIGTILSEYMNRMELIVDRLTKWRSSNESAQYDIWYQNYLRLASIITKHASQVSSVMKLITNLQTNYAKIIIIGQAAVYIYNNNVNSIRDYATTDDDAVATTVANIIVTNLTNLTNNTDLDTDVAAAVAADVAAAVTAANISGDNINLKKSNVVLKVILDKINAAIQLKPQINKITEKLTLIEKTLTIEVGAIENVQNENPPVVIKSFRKNVKFTNDIILNRCNPFSGLGNARRMRTVRTFFNNPNGLDPYAVELGLVIIKQCFDDLYGNSVTLNDINGNSVTFENYFTQQIRKLFGDFYRVANTKGLRPTYRLALTGIPDGYQDRFMNAGLIRQYNISKQEQNDALFGGRVPFESPLTESPLTESSTPTKSSTESTESTVPSKSSTESTVPSKSSTVPTKSNTTESSIPTKSSKSPTVSTVPTVPSKSSTESTKSSTDLLSELIKEIGNMIKKTQEKMEKAEDLKVSIIKKMENYSYAELPYDIIAKSEKIDSIENGFNALIKLLEMVKEFIHKKGTNYINHSNKPDSYEFLQARMQLYQVFFVISFLQTLNQYQQSNPNKPEQQIVKSGGGERSQTQTGGIRESAIKGMLLRKFNEFNESNKFNGRGQIGYNLEFGFDSNIIMEFDIKEDTQENTQENTQGNTQRRRKRKDQPKVFKQKIDNFYNNYNSITFTLEKNKKTSYSTTNTTWILSNDKSPEKIYLSLQNDDDDDYEAVDYFNNTYMLFMGYVIKIDVYDNLLNSVRRDVQDAKSNLLIQNDQLEAQVKYNEDKRSFELNHMSPSVENEQDIIESLDVIIESPNVGGNIMDLIFGEENSEKYDYSLTGNGELYTLFGILATAIYSFFDENNFEYPLLNYQLEMKDKLFSFLGVQSNETIAAGGGKKNKRKITKKKRKQKKHTKKIKFRKKSSKKQRHTKRKKA